MYLLEFKRMSLPAFVMQAFARARNKGRLMHMTFVLINIYTHLQWKFFINEYRYVSNSRLEKFSTPHQHLQENNEVNKLLISIICGIMTSVWSQFPSILHTYHLNTYEKGFL